MARHKLRFFVDASPLAGPRSSGVGHSVLGFVTALAADPEFTDRYQMYLIAPVRGMKNVRTLEIPGVRYISVPLPARIWNRLPGTPVMPFMDMMLGRGVYFLTNFRSWPLAWSKSITLVHDIAFRLYPESLTPGHRQFLEQQVRLWKRRSTLIATVSESAKADIHSHLGIAEDRIVVLHNGVDPRQFSPQPTDRVEALRRKYNLPSEYILYLGNFEPRKNLKRVIQAYVDLPEDLRQKYGLVLIGGSSWLGDELDQQINTAIAGGIHIVRPTSYVTDDELPAIYSGARMLAWPPLHEGFGMPILEAMACGTPVLTANNSSLPEVAGSAALFVDAENTDQIREGIVKLLTDETERQRLIMAGHERVEHFSWSETARKLISIADSLVEGETVKA
jgi:glycosyltransferase involved in cell wall biosynthesis